MEVKEFIKGYNRMCDNIDCANCPINNHSNHRCNNIEYLKEEEIAKVEKWIEEHPIITNAIRFEQVFGFESKDIVGDYYCIPKEWWDSEYIEPKGE